MKNLIVTLTVLLGTFAAMADPSGPVPYPSPGTHIPVGESVYASGGDVQVTFLGKGVATYTDLLWLSSPGSAYSSPSTPIFNNQTSPANSVVDLGSFSAGTELVFGMTDQNVSQTFYTGPASRNPDNTVHAYVVNNYPANGSTYIGFEDLGTNNGADFNYTDVQFTFTGITGAVPEPSTVALVGLGAAGLIVRRRK